ncbi:MAG TPA: branched-chain amino acid ABC transporter permease [Burkholderiaceae bacterium]|nr:branched-chain amino acid ABC transporter permease [Burkholderiaceae bacterium]
MRALFDKTLWAAIVVGVLIIFAVPFFVEVYALYNLTVFAVLAILALSLGLVWGFGGILALGQSAFFGVGAYVYATVAINMADSTWALPASILAAVIFAACVGYFTFYGRVSDIYFAVISLTIPLILLNLVNSASGPAYQFGEVHLGGYNGIPGVPPVNNPFDPSDFLSFEGMYYLAAFALLVVYVLLRLFLASRFGRVVVAVRDNELRAELLGYDVRLYKLAVFCLGAGVAGFGGALYAAWGSSVGPNVFSLAFAAHTVVWVLFGGLGTLLGPIIGSFVVQGLSTWLGGVSRINPEIALGLFFIAAVLLLPSGVVPTLRNWLRRKRTRGQS